MPVVRYLLLILACLAVFNAGANASIIDGGTSYYNTTPPAQIFYNIFDNSEAIANIQCNVYTYESGDYKDKYAYTYQITNTSDVDLKFLTMQIFSGVELEDYGFDEGSGINPNYWGPAGSPIPYGFDAHFSDTISIGEQSALLWFVSSQMPGEIKGNGSLFGTYDPWTGVYTEGELITPAPIPEPATFLLISMGTFAIIRRRKSSQEAV